MDFKDLPLKVQLVLMMMHSVGIIEAMAEGQNLTQEQFQHAVVQSFASMGIDQNYMNDLLENLNADEDRLMKDYLEDLGIEVADESDGHQEPKVH